MKNIHVLPTEKPSRLMIDTIENKLYLQPILHEKTINVLTQNIYITSSEEIKEGDWFYFDDAEIIAKYIDLKPVEEAKKIVLTTNQDLVKDGVQAIDDEFLEWFVKNSSCERVEVVLDDTSFVISDIIYKIIIPKEIGFKVENGKRTETFYSKEEPTIEEKYLKDELKKYDGIDVVVLNKPEEPKQETLEEFAKRIINENHFYNYKSLMQLVIMGAKWQQEQMYSEEEVELIANEMVNWAIDNVGNPNPQSGKKFDEVIAKFKNK